ncbi:MAG TPA: hypothetical protein VFG36_02215 [Methanoregula sp.]|nr:hypothetical protein [Methanoregula sp.]
MLRISPLLSFVFRSGVLFPLRITSPANSETQAACVPVGTAIQQIGYL